jgi:GNAT superfamily N-acetyltransferase
MPVRARRDVDVDRLCDLVRAVHAADGYPVLLQEDVRSFILTNNCLAAWVCELQGQIVGHVALHTIWSDEVAQLASSSLRRPRKTLASVSRLFVDPTCRRLGLGAQLFEVVTRDAHDRGLWPVLDVVTTYTAAVALYEKSGWSHLGTIALPMPDGRAIDEHVYAAPDPSNRP